MSSRLRVASAVSTQITRVQASGPKSCHLPRARELRVVAGHRGEEEDVEDLTGFHELEECVYVLFGGRLQLPRPHAEGPGIVVGLQELEQRIIPQSLIHKPILHRLGAVRHSALDGLLEAVRQVDDLLQVLQPQREDDGREHVHVVEQQRLEVELHVGAAGREVGDHVLPQLVVLVLQDLLQTVEEFLFRDDPGAVASLEVRGENPQQLTAELLVVTGERIGQLAQDQQQVGQEIGLGREPPHRGVHIDSELKCVVFVACRLFDVLQHERYEGRALAVGANPTPARHDVVDELTGFLAAELEVLHWLLVPKWHRRVLAHIRLQHGAILRHLLALLPARLLASGPRRRGTRGLRRRMVRGVLGLAGASGGSVAAALGTRLPSMQRNRQRVLEVTLEVCGLLRGDGQPVGREQDPGVGDDVLKHPLGHLSLVH
mmetsp:Transcript_56058/g.181712  ORF Transcript_56058/g.181712 Transcript_56058/m.181712 type:complete len:431 (-) Transcript_56058:1216-2508(-)